MYGGNGRRGGKCSLILGSTVRAVPIDDGTLSELLDTWIPVSSFFYISQFTGQGEFDLLLTGFL